jgi:8-oxo-dGTP pyrophosphatase MutT (NUDIX family)
MLSQQSETKEHFLSLLKEHSPHHQAASRFNMKIEETVKFMHEIEDDINKKLEEKIENYRWIDYTEIVKINHAENMKYYLVIS